MKQKVTSSSSKICFLKNFKVILVSDMFLIEDNLAKKKKCCCLLNALPSHLVGNQQRPSRRFATQNLPPEHRYSQVHFSHHGHRSTCQGLSWKVFSHPKPCRIAEKITHLWSQSYALKSIYFEVIYLKLSIIQSKYNGMWKRTYHILAFI